MAKHVGIVGCSIPGAALCYRELCEYASHLMGQYDHPQVTLSNIPLATYMRCFDQMDLAGVAKLMLESARIVAAAGADFAICPDNSCHLAYEEVAKYSPIPWLHIARVVTPRRRVAASANLACSARVLRCRTACTNKRRRAAVSRRWYL